MVETVTLQHNTTEVLQTTAQSQSKSSAPSISQQPLIRLLSGFFIYVLLYALFLPSISGNFPTAVFLPF